MKLDLPFVIINTIPVSVVACQEQAKAIRFHRQPTCGGGVILAYTLGSAAISHFVSKMMKWQLGAIPEHPIFPPSWLCPFSRYTQ